MRSKIVAIRAYTLPQVQPDPNHDDHWRAKKAASPMSRYPHYRDSRNSWGLNLPGTLIVEVESAAGEVGLGVGSGGVPACWIVEHHLARFVEGQSPTDVERIWDQMYWSTIHYGRRGLALQAISAVDLALWDLIGRQREAPVYELLGGPVRDHLDCYATGTQPELAQDLGFIGGKLPLTHSPADGEEGLRANIERARIAREAVGPDFMLMYDCWMALDVPYAIRLFEGLEPYRLTWIEEPLHPDDFSGLQQLALHKTPGLMLTAGEHEATRWGFKSLLDASCVDVIQPDVRWCGGLSELVRISALADAYNIPVVTHGASVYGYHYAISRLNNPYAEFQVMSPEADEVVPMFSPLLIDEPAPDQGRITLSDRAGFGVELNQQVQLERPFPH